MGPGRHRSTSATRSGGSLRIFWIRVSSAITSLGGIVGPGDVWPCAGTRSAGRTGFRVSGSVHAARRSRSIWSSQAAIWFQLAGIRDAIPADKSSRVNKPARVPGPRNSHARRRSWSGVPQGECCRPQPSGRPPYSYRQCVRDQDTRSSHRAVPAPSRDYGCSPQWIAADATLRQIRQ
jgi:hypothetical protein